MNNTLWRGAALLAVFTAATVLAVPATAKSFGTTCQEEYQNNWQTTLSYFFEICSGFNNQLDNTDTLSFYWNLSGQKNYWENTWDQYEPETVDLFFGATHGGGWSGRAVWAMYDQNSFADSTYMRLGDEAAPQTSVLSTYSCETLKADGQQWTRYGPIFSGGVRIATGSHGTLWSSLTTDECGQDYAAQLQAGAKIKFAWKDGLTDWATAQDAAVMATGSTSADCWSRLDNMTWQNVTAYPRLRDGANAYWCQYYWDDL